MQQIDIVTRQQFDELPKDKNYMLKFWASWCGPCKALQLTIDQMISQHPEKDFVIYNIDVDKHSDIAQLFGIRGIPTMTFIKNGENKATSIGNQPALEIHKLLQAL